MRLQKFLIMEGGKAIKSATRLSSQNAKPTLDKNPN